jgi:hypothetical protein
MFRTHTSGGLTIFASCRKQSNPRDWPTVCNGNSVNGNLTSVCTGASLASAYNVYAATCSAQGIAVGQFYISLQPYQPWKHSSSQLTLG